MQEIQNKWIANNLNRYWQATISTAVPYFLVLISVSMLFTFANFSHRLRQIELKIIQMIPKQILATAHHHQSKISFRKDRFHILVSVIFAKISHAKMALITDYTVLHEWMIEEIGTHTRKNDKILSTTALIVIIVINLW